MKKGSDVLIPGYIKAKDLSKRLEVKLQEVVKFCREKGFRFKKPSEIIVDYTKAAQFAEQLGYNPVYEGMKSSVELNKLIL